WFYDIESIIPVLNENDKVKVGKGWVIILKYILPVFLFIMWFSGVYNLIQNANGFEAIVYTIITIAIIILSYIFTNIKK
ncbi:MAG: sodium-dependent transporter, partial [Methanobrevibacter sp.]|nr:sodium-dependent transporter [Methanobrevibacter sp.]